VLVYEIFELEALAGGVLHHAVDALFVAVCGYAAAAISRSRGFALGVLSTGAAGWSLDFFGLAWQPVDIESLAWMIMHLLLLFILARRLLQSAEITGNTILDALALYLVSGIMFAHIYSMLVWYIPTGLVAQGLPAGERITFGLILYYSFVTQVAVGFGDITPAHQLTRAVTIFQSIYGVMFVAVLIARFVSLHSAAQWSRQHPRTDPDS
jgi:hypothetical protein